MSKYLSEVLPTAPNPAVEEPVAASGGTGGASAPILKVGDIEPAEAKKPFKKWEGLNTKKTIKFSKAVEETIASKLAEYNASCPTHLRTTLDPLRAVYRRGAGSYVAANTATLSRHDWAMARVNAFTTLLAGGATNPSYTYDFDLLPVGHKKSEMPVSAAAGDVYQDALAITVLDEDDYETSEQAIHTLAELSGLGYEIIPAIRAAWMRGIQNNENPYERAAVLASALYNSPDADLLPKEGIL
jgi:hypothetical protein